jgi:hypothetical protein
MTYFLSRLFLALIKSSSEKGLRRTFLPLIGGFAVGSSKGVNCKQCGNTNSLTNGSSTRYHAITGKKKFIFDPALDPIFFLKYSRICLQVRRLPRCTITVF